MKIIYLVTIFCILAACSTKTTDVIIESESDVMLDKLHDIKITRIQKGKHQVNDTNNDNLNYYLFLTDGTKDIPLEIINGKVNNRCKVTALNLNVDGELSNTYEKFILFEKHQDEILVTIDCVTNTYKLPLINTNQQKIKLIVEDKEFKTIKDSVFFNIRF